MAQDNDTRTFKAKHEYARISAQKMRYVADMIREQNVMDAQNILGEAKKKGAKYLAKLLRSAVSNAEHEITEKGLSIDPERLMIEELKIEEGPTYKRWMPRARGRATEKRKRTTHATMILKPDPEQGF